MTTLADRANAELGVLLPVDKIPAVPEIKVALDPKLGRDRLGFRGQIARNVRAKVYIPPELQGEVTKISMRFEQDPHTLRPAKNDPRFTAVEFRDDEEGVLVILYCPSAAEVDGVDITFA